MGRRYVKIKLGFDNGFNSLNEGYCGDFMYKICFYLMKVIEEFF